MCVPPSLFLALSLSLLISKSSLRLLPLLYPAGLQQDGSSCKAPRDNFYCKMRYISKIGLNWIEFIFWCLFQNDSSSSSLDMPPLYNEDNRTSCRTSGTSCKVIPNRIFVRGFDYLVWPRHMFSNSHRTWLTAFHQSIFVTLKRLLQRNVCHIPFIPDTYHKIIWLSGFSLLCDRAAVH